jgi:hypothetical protein
VQIPPALLGGDLSRVSAAVAGVPSLFIGAPIKNFFVAATLAMLFSHPHSSGWW